MKALLESLKKLRVVVIGDVMLDHYIWGDVERISPEAPVPVVMAERDTYVVGGAANVAFNVQSLGAEATLVGNVGADAAGDRLRHLLASRGVSFASFSQSEKVPSIVKTRVVVRSQQLCRIDREERPSAYAISPASFGEIVDLIADADAVIVSDYAKGVVTPELMGMLKTNPYRNKILLALDPKPKHAIDYSGLDLLTPNRQEALQLSGVDRISYEEFPADLVCNTIFEKYTPKHLVITLGADGMLMQGEGSPWAQVPTCARQVYDVSGAGDTCIAALTLALSSKHTLAEAVHFANTAAGIVVAKVGTATVSPQEILDYYE